MKKYVKDKKGRVWEVDFYCTIEREFENANREGKTWVSYEDGWTYENKHLSVYWSPERTWDDHLGNTECGYYVILPLPSGERRRVYMF